MQFDAHSLRASARLSGRSVPEEYKYEVLVAQRAAYAGLPLRKDQTGEWGYDVDQRARGVKYGSERHQPPEYTVAGTHPGAASDD